MALEATVTPRKVGVISLFFAPSCLSSSLENFLAEVLLAAHSPCEFGALPHPSPLLCDARGPRRVSGPFSPAVSMLSPHGNRRSCPRCQVGEGWDNPQHPAEGLLGSVGASVTNPQVSVTLSSTSGNHQARSQETRVHCVSCIPGCLWWFLILTRSPHSPAG